MSPSTKYHVQRVVGLPTPEEGTIVSFADDLAIVVMAKHVEGMEVYATHPHQIKELRLNG